MNDLSVKAIQLTQCNNLLQRVISEARDEESYVSGILNVVAVSKHYGFSLMLGQIPVEAFSAAYPKWMDLFENPTVFNEIGRHFYILDKRFDRLKDMRFVSSTEKANTNYHCRSLLLPEVYKNKSLHVREHNREFTKLGTFVIGVDRIVKYTLDRELNPTCNIAYGSVINNDYASFKITFVLGKSISRKVKLGVAAPQAGVQINVESTNPKTIPLLYLAFLFGRINRVRDLYEEKVQVHEFALNLALSIALDGLLAFTKTTWAVPYEAAHEYQDHRHSRDSLIGHLWN